MDRVPRAAMLCSLVLVAMACSADTLRGAEAPADDKDRQIRELQQQVRRLEARVAQLEKAVGSLAAANKGTGGTAATTDAAKQDANRQRLVQKAHERMRQDLQTHTAEQLGEAEVLYQVANKKFGSPESRQSLRKMIDKFPHLNRTGCALLYLAQMSKEDEREKLLEEAVQGHSDCFYGDGVQVGGLARLMLGQWYLQTKRPQKAKAVFDEIRKDYPDAIDHKGKLLVEQIPAEGNQDKETRRQGN